MEKYFLAIDIGASSGRHIAGWVKDGKIETREVYRFPNGAAHIEGHLAWELDRLTCEVEKGIDEAVRCMGKPESFSIDTWGVDYVLMDGEKEILPCFSYRDSRTEEAIREVHKVLPFSTLYKETGIQFQPFNTIYQLYADKMTGRLDHASDFLYIPEYLTYKLCGRKSHEYTIATTSGLVNAYTREYAPDIINALGLPDRLFHKLEAPGTLAGEYRGIKAILCAGHDTASAVEGIPMDGSFPYISSGTWSLLGVKTEKPVIDSAGELSNWSNEGGPGYIRYQKNIMGMWVVNRLRDEISRGRPFEKIIESARNSRFDETVDINANELLAPESMKEAFDEALSMKAAGPGDYFRCAFRSLALSYMNALQELEHNTRRKYDRIYIVGGGAKNEFLNELTHQVTGKKVIALPIEATALGNQKIQMEAANEL